jgi:hypothetical protein
MAAPDLSRLSDHVLSGGRIRTSASQQFSHDQHQPAKDEVAASVAIALKALPKRRDGFRI